MCIIDESAQIICIRGESFVVDAKSVIKGRCVSQTIEDDMRAVLKDLRGKITIGTVGGSDLDKQIEQLGSTGMSCCI